MSGVNIFADHAACFAQVQAELGQFAPTLTWGDSNYVVIPNSARQGHNLTVGGQSWDCDLIINALTSTFLTTALTSATAIKNAMLDTFAYYAGDKYKITNVHILPGQLQLMIGLNSGDQNA